MIGTAIAIMVGTSDTPVNVEIHECFDRSAPVVTIMDTDREVMVLDRLEEVLIIKEN